MRTIIIFAIAFLEGFTTLSVEIVAIRSFTPIIWTNSISTSVILWVILLALSYWYYIWGKLSATGKNLEKTFKSADEVEKVEIEKKKVKFLYSRKGKVVFLLLEEKKRIEVEEEKIEEKIPFLLENNIYDSVWFEEELIDLVLPVKMDFKVIEAPPAFKGNTVSGGTKEVIIETGFKVKVPLFIKEGDLIRINTETKEYVQRVEKE